MHERATSLSPSPRAASAPHEADDGSLDIDWDYWLSVNPDIVGWVSVPGTPVSYPVVQAPADDPTFYLHHDVYRQPNFAGVPYLDADCAEGGLLGSRNAVIFGHNLGMGDQTLFAPFASYTDAAFATVHKTIMLQTPETTVTLEVHASKIMGGWELAKRTTFEGDADFKAWYADAYRSADVRLLGDAAPQDIEGVFTFCTCSYNYWSNERTLVYAAVA